jgi:protein-disulfide isomerase
MSKRQELRELKRKQKEQRKMITIGAIIIGAGLIAAALIYPSLSRGQEFASRYMAKDNAMGNPNAPIKIVEFSDYHCGHCGAFALETEPILVKEYIETDKVYFIYRTAGGMIGGPESALAAEASYCAGEQNMFWEMHDIIFANQTLPFSSVNLQSWAKKINLNLDAYDACMTEGIYAERAIKDEEDAKSAGVSGTPSFIISYVSDGELIEQMLPGNYPIEAFRQVIDEGLEAAGK